MAGHLANRWQLALTGAVGGLCLWALVQSFDDQLIGDQWAVVLGALIVTHFAVTLAMAGPTGLRRALPRAFGLALVVAGLVWLAGLRYADGIIGQPLSVLAVLVVASLPVPFLIAQARQGWRDYPALFLEAWSIVVRYAAAWAFAGLVGLVIFLSDQVLRIVGITAIADLLEFRIVSLTLAGAVLGLGMAVVYELADLLSPYLVLRLFRLLLPVVLGVMLVFLVALPLRGLEGLFNGLSPSLLLLTMVAAGVSLVSVTIDQSDADASQSALMGWAAQGMALILPIMAGLAGWAIGLRVNQYGWTPERLFVAFTAALGLAYGLVYAQAVLRRSDWMARIRQGNVHLALAVIVVAGLWLTPVLNAERISAQSLWSRLIDGRTNLADLDVAALGNWGLAGQAVQLQIEDRATEPGQEALAAVLTGDGPFKAADQQRAATTLAAAMPVQPASATGTRDSLLALSGDDMLADWQSVCDRKLEGGEPACLMVVADLLPTFPGEEAMLVLERSADYVEMLGLYVATDGMLMTRPVRKPDGRYPDTAEAAALLRDWQSAPPALTPALVNQLGTGASGLLILP